MIKDVAVIGTGQAAFALAAFFYTNNINVYMYKDSVHPGLFKYINGSFRTTGVFNAEINLSHVSYDLERITDKCKIIFIVAPTYSHKRYYAMLSKYISKNNVLCNVTGNFTSIFSGEYLKKSNINICDISLSPFACRFEKNNTINLIGLKKYLYASCLDPNKNNETIKLINEIFPSQLVCAKNVIEVGLKNINGICHPAIMVLNAARIGNNNSFYFNRDGVNENVAFVLESLDRDRRAICKAYGIEDSNFLFIMNQFYGENFKSILQFFKSSAILNRHQLCPSTIGGRYFDEDIGFLLLSWKSLANFKNIQCTTIDSIIHMASILNQKNYFQHGRVIQDINIEYCDTLKLDFTP